MLLLLHLLSLSFLVCLFHRGDMMVESSLTRKRLQDQANRHVGSYSSMFKRTSLGAINSEQSILALHSRSFI